MLTHKLDVFDNANPPRVTGQPKRLWGRVVHSINDINFLIAYVVWSRRAGVQEDYRVGKRTGLILNM